jgi:hypothetical protein
VNWIALATIFMVPVMPRRCATILQAEVARIIRAAKQAGAPAVAVYMRDGTIITVPLNPNAVGPPTPLRLTEENKHSDDDEIVL